MRAAKACREWLSYCLRIGWDRKYLDQLQALWMEYHDEDGRLIKANQDGGSR